MTCDFMFFNISSVILGRWVDENERLCAIVPFMVEKISPRAELEPGTARSVGHRLTHWG